MKPETSIQKDDSSMFHSFEDLEVWKKSCQLAVWIYEATETVLDRTLSDQMRRAAVSIPSNIAEGYERGGKDFLRFLRIASGSAAELRTQVFIAGKMKIITISLMTELVRELKEISKMIRGLSKARTESKKRERKTETPQID